jgi:hypothetical protein
MDLDADIWWGKGGGSRPNNPLADETGPVGEYPEVPPRSGVEAVLNAANAITTARHLADKLADALAGA